MNIDINMYGVQATLSKVGLLTERFQLHIFQGGYYKIEETDVKSALAKCQTIMHSISEKRATAEMKDIHRKVKLGVFD